MYGLRVAIPISVRIYRTASSPDRGAMDRVSQPPNPAGGKGPARTNCSSFVPLAGRKTPPAFLEELSPLPQAYSNFRFIPSMSETAQSKRPWKGETGFIDREMLARHLSQLDGAAYYSAGPPAMVAAMRKMLAGAGVDEDDVRTEEFGGY